MKQINQCFNIVTLKTEFNKAKVYKRAAPILLDWTDDNEKCKYALFKCIAKVIQLGIMFAVSSANSVETALF